MDCLLLDRNVLQTVRVHYRVLVLLSSDSQVVWVDSRAYKTPMIKVFLDVLLG